MRNYFGVTQRHIGSKAVYNYIASRRNRNGVRNNRLIIKPIHISKNKRIGMVKNTKLLNNHNWGKIPIGVHTRSVL